MGEPWRTGGRGRGVGCGQVIAESSSHQRRKVPGFFCQRDKEKAERARRKTEELKREPCLAKQGIVIGQHGLFFRALHFVRVPKASERSCEHIMSGALHVFVLPPIGKCWCIFGSGKVAGMGFHCLIEGILVFLFTHFVILRNTVSPDIRDSRPRRLLLLLLCLWRCPCHATRAAAID